MLKRVTAAVVALFLAIGVVGLTSASARVGNAGKIKITVVGYNAKGADVVSNRNEEYIKLVNVSGADVVVTGWTVGDSVGNDTELDASADMLIGGVLPAGASIVVYSGLGNDGTANSTHAIFRNGGHYLNNGGDVITVRDAAGSFVDRLAYDDFGINPTP